MDYKQAGVDIERGEAFVERIKAKVRSTYDKRVLAGVGGFAGLYKIGKDRLLAVGADGVGTKIMLAQQEGCHSGIGIDLVAMCVNDIVCTGARPLFFMDYWAVGKLEGNLGEILIDSIVEGCRQSECALLGGETAEMPGLYQPGEYDLAGFAVGEVEMERLIGGDKVKSGMTLIGLPSSGIHSNGYSLVRQFLKPGERELARELLTPTRIYWPLLAPILEKGWLAGAAHITGGGFFNISRMNPQLDYHIQQTPQREELPPSFQTILNRTGLSRKELFKTFNMGVGMVLAATDPEPVTAHLREQGESFWILGKTTPGHGQVLLDGNLL